MARIREYELDRDLDINDKVLGTDVTNGGTMNFSLNQLGEFLASRGLADPSALDFQFRYVEGGLVTEKVASGAIHYDATTPAGITTILMSSTDLKGESTEPFAAILQGASLELNDTIASQGTNYTFFNVATEPTRLDDGSGFLIPVSLSEVSGDLVPSTAELPQTEFVNLGVIGLTGGIGNDGLTPVITQPTPGEFHISYELEQNPADVDITIPPGEPGNSIGATTSTDTTVTPNTHTVTFTTSDGSTPPAPFTITDGAVGPGTEAIAAGSYPVAADGTVTMTKENGGGSVIITGIGASSPIIHQFNTAISTPTEKEGNVSALVDFPDNVPAGGAGFTYSIVSAVTTDSGWSAAIDTGLNPHGFDVQAAPNEFSSTTVSARYLVTDTTQTPNTHESVDATYRFHTYRGTFTGSQQAVPGSYILPGNDIARLSSGQTVSFTRPGSDTDPNWYALIAIPTATATPAQLTFNDGGIITVSGLVADQFAQAPYVLYYFEVTASSASYSTTITF